MQFVLMVGHINYSEIKYYFFLCVFLDCSFGLFCYLMKKNVWWPSYRILAFTDCCSTYSPPTTSSWFLFSFFYFNPYCHQKNLHISASSGTLVILSPSVIHCGPHGSHFALLFGVRVAHAQWQGSRRQEKAADDSFTDDFRCILWAVLIHFCPLMWLVGKSWCNHHSLACCL